MQLTMQTFGEFKFVWLCFFFVAILQFLLLHLGTDKCMCSLMRKVSRYVHLPGWKTIKFPFILIYNLSIFINDLYEKSELEKVFTSFFADYSSSNAQTYKQHCDTHKKKNHNGTLIHLYNPADACKPCTMSGWAELSRKYCYIRCNNLPQVV